MNCFKNVYALFDISSSEDEDGTLERASTPFPLDRTPNYRVVLEISHSSAVAIAVEEEYFDTSAYSLEADCKRMNSESSFKVLESGE